MTIQEQIRSAAADLLPGHTARVVCPHCDARHEKSFAITRDPERPWRLLFMCHRGTCSSRSGFVEDRAGATMVLSRWDSEPYADLDLSRHQPATQEFLEDTCGKYGIGLGYLRRQGVEYDPKGHALCMPWLSQDGVQVGWVEKRFDPNEFKSHHELASRSYASRLSFPRANTSYAGARRRGGVAILVESLLDAYRLGELAERDDFPLYPIALLGAQISQNDTHHIASLFDKVVVLLDPDQWPKGSIRVAKHFRVYPVETHLMTMESDPKDASEAEIISLFWTISESF